MIRILSILLALTVALSACAPSSTSGGKAGGSYRISRSDAGTIQFRMLDSVNALRSSAGVTPLALDAKLNAAAATHSRDMSVQNRLDGAARHPPHLDGPRWPPDGFLLVSGKRWQDLVDAGRRQLIFYRPNGLSGPCGGRFRFDQPGDQGVIRIGVPSRTIA